MDGRSSIDMLLSKNRDVLNRASMMADQKASIILGSEFIILSLIVTGIWSRSSEAGANFPPLWSISIFVSILLSVIFSLIVLIPSFGKKSPKGQKPATSSLLFFGSIGQMEHQEYKDEMKELLQSDESIYDAIISDLYFEAKVLRQKKYRFLRYSYIALIGGVFLSIVIFLAEMLIRQIS